MVFAFAGDSTTTRLRANPTSLAFRCRSEGTDGVVSPTHSPLCQGSDSVPVFPELVIRLSTPPDTRSLAQRTAGTEERGRTPIYDARVAAVGSSSFDSPAGAMAVPACEERHSAQPSMATDTTPTTTRSGMLSA